MPLIDMFISWLKQQRPSVSWTWRCSWPDASDEKCKICGIMRKDHSSKVHPFNEGI